MRLFIVTATLIFSCWLMFHTFSYSAKTSSLLISDKVWSDFSGHLPLVRSFSKGQNWPPENPLFPGEKIRYHFLFFLIVGMLERIGLRIDLAMNIPSIVGFWGLLLMIYVWSKKIFKSFWAGLVAIILFLFNGSLSFGTYFSKNGVSVESFKNIFINSSYPNFGPWDGGKIAAIWNLNIFTNQRHLAPALALALLILYIVNFEKIKPLLLGILIGFLIFLNEAIFAGLAIFLFWHFVLNKRDWKYLILCGISTLPWYLLSRILINTTPMIQFKPGFLMNETLTIFSVLNYWWQNLGLYMFLFPVAVVIAPRQLRKLVLPVITLFAVVNLFQLSPDMFNNHKLLNMDMVVVVIFVAGLIMKISTSKVKFIMPIILIILTFSGVIDFFALKNDRKLSIVDNNPDILFVENNVPKGGVVLNSTWLYHPASLAGRPIFNGYTYFTWSHGYDSYGREKALKDIYQAASKIEACSLLIKENISYVELNEHPESYLKPNFNMWNNDFAANYKNESTGVRFYDVEKNCQT